MQQENPSTSLRFLLVDDERQFVEVISERLRQRGFGVDCAYSGAEALARLKGADDIDVVVLDVQLPDGDGLDFLRAIKAQTPLVEVILLTGHGTIDSATEALKFGAFDYLTKPCDIQVLEEKIKDACQVKRDREARIVEANVQLIALRRGD